MADNKRTLQYLTLLPVAIFTTGCTALGVASDFISANNSTKPCYRNLQENPKYEMLFKKLAIAGQFPTDEQLADTERPSPEVIQAGMRWYEETQICGKNALEIYSNMSPEFGARVAGWLAEMTEIFNDTMAKNPPYGYINARIKHLRERQKADIQDWVRAETRRRQAQVQPGESDFLLSAFTVALQVLTHQQLAIFHVQHKYALRVPTYRPVQITKTSCYFVGKKFVCRLDPQDIAQGAEEVMKEIQFQRDDQDHP